MFKVGDFLRNQKGKPFQLESEHIWQNKHACKKWEPEKGEWCWFWNDFEYPVLGKFNGMDSNIYLAITTDLDEYGYQYSEPFIGTLPTRVKDK